MGKGQTDLNHDSHRDPDYICFLIHGTWGQQAAFASPDSEFASTISNDLEGCVTFHRFKWSGKNNHEERLKAGEELSLAIKKSANENASARVVLIAHSHGGNVARYAMRDPRTARIVDKLICMSTPFLSSELRKPINGLTLFLIWQFALVLFGGSAFTSILMLAIGTPNPILVRDAMIVMVAGVSVVGLLLIFRWRVLPKHHNAMLAFERWFTLAAQRTQRRYDVHRSVNTKTYVISVSGDEALWWLSQLTRLSEMPVVLWRIFERLIMLLFWILAYLGLLFVLVGAVLALFKIDPDKVITAIGGPFDQTVVLMTLLAVAGSFFALGLLLGIVLLAQIMFRSHRFAFGDDLRDNLACRIHTTRWPVGDPPKDSYHHRLWLYELGRHSKVYSEMAVFKRIVEWIRD